MTKDTTPNIFIIHGTTGHPGENWYPWLKQELKTIGYETTAPTFPTPAGQSLTSWKKVFYDQIGAVQSNMVLVGHSIGAGFILNILEESATPVLGSFFVCGFIGPLGLPEFDSLNQSFVCRQFNWQKIRQNMGNACLFSGDDDPYVPLAKAEELADKLQIPVTLVPGAKHINAAAGYTRFPLLLEKIKALLSREP